MPIDGATFRKAMGRLATGITVVSVRGADGRAVGMTASAVTSLSLEPPMVLLCVGHVGVLHQALASAETFGVAILAEDQEALSRRFAARETQHFDGLNCATSPAGLPILPGALAYLECRRSASVPGGDHTIVTGTVEWASAADGRPLLYFAGGYRRLAE